MEPVRGLSDLLAAIVARDDIAPLLAGHPSLATHAVDRADERFLEECGLQLYAGDTALHVAAAAHDVAAVGALLDAGADVGATNRRGAQPLHSATRGGPGSVAWEPAAQVAVIDVLVAAGADVDARSTGGVTPLHQAVRNRCSAAVVALLAAGADPTLANDRGSTAHDLTRWTTGRGGTGSPEARAELAAIVTSLERWNAP